VKINKAGEKAILSLWNEQSERNIKLNNILINICLNSSNISKYLLNVNIFYLI